jgi:Flp pilus assembly protein TadG
VRGSATDDTGQAAVELAMVLPLVAVVVASLVDIAAFCVARVSLEHLAGAAARTAAAANRPERSVAELLERVAGDSSDEFSFEITQDGLLITVTLERRRRASWSPLALLGSRTMTTQVTAALEPIRGP